MIRQIIYKVITLLTGISENYKYAQYRKKYKLPASFKFGGAGNLIYGDGGFYRRRKQLYQSGIYTNKCR